MPIDKCSPDQIAAWVALRIALWPDEDPAIMAREAPAMLDQPDGLVRLARNGDGVVGFVEASMRRDYVNGCETSPVAFVEGIYVMPQHRGHGVARALVAAVESWAREQGITELASDALLNNRPSHAMHQALGFSETERVVYFRKVLL